MKKVLHASWHSRLHRFLFSQLRQGFSFGRMALAQVLASTPLEQEPLDLVVQAFTRAGDLSGLVLIFQTQSNARWASKRMLVFFSSEQPRSGIIIKPVYSEIEKYVCSLSLDAVFFFF